MNPDKLVEKFPSIQILDKFRNEESILVPVEDLFDVLKFLKEDEDYSFTMLVDLTAVDYLGKRDSDRRFEIVYHLYSLKYREYLRVKTVLPEANQRVPSITSLWTGANWLEREVFDMFGIEFDGHPNLKRILMWDDFDGHPLRKDYPLREEPPLPEPK